jgi:Peptidase family M28
MAQVRAAAVPRPLVRLPRAKPLGGLAALLFITALAALGVFRLTPPAAMPAGVAATEFSSGRAMLHLREVARAAHPVGSAEHARVREYIVGELSALGAAPEVQSATAVSERWGAPYRAATVHNVLGRLRGTEGGPAVALVAHYDSVPTGPGANDDGAGVAALLETLRALKAGPQLKRDVVFLFTDAEEVGLLGARAFVEGHAWAKDVGVVLNFEARGDGGPATMFETSGGNGWLIREFAAAAPRPVANSLSYELYKILPNDTDMSVFKAAGLPGLNFAYVEGAARYHTGADHADAVSGRSLQHHGSYALALARHFGGLSLAPTKAADSVYFDLFGAWLVRYPAAWSMPLMSMVLALFAAVVALGVGRGLLTPRGVVYGFLIFLLGMVSAVVSVTLLWWAARALHEGYGAFVLGDIYNSGPYMLGFAALSAAVAAALYAFFRKRIGVEDLSVGALLWWLLLTLLTSFVLPGGSYLFAWPLAFSLLALAAVFILGTRGEERGGAWKRLAVLSAGAAPGVALLAPTIYLIFVGLTLGMAGVAALLVVLAFGLLLPLVGFAAPRRRWMLPGLLALAGVASLAAGSLSAGFDGRRPRPDNVFYGLNADTAKAVWASADESPDAWTSQFFPGAAERGALPEFLPLSRRPLLQAQAPAEQLDAPRIELLGDEAGGGVRTLRLRVTSPRRAPVVTVAAEQGARVVGSAINGKRIEIDARAQAERPWAVRYHGLPAEGFELTLQTDASGPVALRAVDQSYGLPEVGPVRPRPQEFTASIHTFGDSTFVTKSFRF